MKEKEWIEERRSILLKELVHQMLLAKLFFEELYENYKKSSQISFKKLASWIGTETNKGSLWNLKDSSHLLFRNNASKVFFYGSVFDWTLGSIFHEGMKLKEDVYLTEVYQKEGKVFIDGVNIPEDVNIEELLEEYKIIITRAKESAHEEMDNLRYLFSKGMEQLQRLIVRFKDDGLLIRFLVENDELYNRVYGQGALKEIFKNMYERGLEDAYLRVGKNYREGGWYSEALIILKRALELNPDNEEIRSESNQIQQIVESLK
jgi:tetratricopeptide (TPR) repeat protein